MTCCFFQSRYGSVSASWSSNSANQTYSPYMSGDASDRSKNAVYGSVSERIFRSNKDSPVLNYDFQAAGNSSFNGQATRDNNAHHSREEFQLHSQNHGSWGAQTRPRSIQSNYLQIQVLESRKQVLNCLNSSPTPRENQKMLKRKSPDSNLDLDLNLSLRPPPEIPDHRWEKMNTTAELGSSLSLSLFSPSPSKLSRLKEGDGIGSMQKGASTLDLTL